MTGGITRLILTGESGCGKTQTCRAVASALGARGWRVAGILSPGIWTNGEKTGIEALDLRSGEVRRLADRLGTSRKIAGPATRGWQFDADALAWCNARLADVSDTDLLIVDELGPLELERGEGFMQGLRVVDAGRFRLGLVVVRRQLQPIAQRRWPDAKVLLVSNPSEVQDRAREIVDLAMRAGASTS